MGNTQGGHLLTIFASFVVGLVVGVIVAPPPTPIEVESVVDKTMSALVAHVMIDYGDGTILTDNNIPIMPNETALSLLKKVSARKDIELGYKDYGEMGVMIETINGKGVKTSPDAWWQYWVNNTYAQVGVSAQNISRGDIVLFKLDRGQL